MNSLDLQFYQQELLDHYRHPRNCGILSAPDVTTQTLNPSCGDQISLQITVQEGILSQIAFQGKGCVISQASASMLTEKCLREPIEVLEGLGRDDMLILVGIPLGPTRLRCALLSLEALQTALAQYRSR